MACAPAAAGDVDTTMTAGGRPVKPSSVEKWDIEGARVWRGCGKGKTSVVTRTRDKARVVKRVTEALDADVFGRELFWLKRLSGVPRFPQLLAYDPVTATFLLSFCGDQLTLENLPDDAEAQMTAILAALDAIDCRVEDVMRRNILVRDGVLHLCDFGWSCTPLRDDATVSDPTCGVGLADVHKPTVGGEVTRNGAYLDMVRGMADERARCRALLGSVDLGDTVVPFAISEIELHTYATDDYTGTNLDRAGNALGAASPLEVAACDTGIELFPRVRGRPQSVLLLRAHPDYDAISAVLDAGPPFALTLMHTRHKHYPLLVMRAEPIEEE